MNTGSQAATASRMSRAPSRALGPATRYISPGKHQLFIWGLFSEIADWLLQPMTEKVSLTLKDTCEKNS